MASIRDPSRIAWLYSPLPQTKAMQPGRRASPRCAALLCISFAVSSDCCRTTEAGHSLPPLSRASLVAQLFISRSSRLAGGSRLLLASAFFATTPSRSRRPARPSCVCVCCSVLAVFAHTHNRVEATAHGRARSLARNPVRRLRGAGADACF